MSAWSDAVQWASNATWVLLALVALRLWLRERHPAAAWVAAAFSITGLVVIVAQMIPDGEVPTTTLKVVVLGILALPWCLHRFTVSMDGIRRGVGIALDAAVALMAVATLAIPRFPPPGEPTGTWLAVYSFMFLVLWVVLTGRTGWRLWRSSIGQPGVIRTRMRLLSAASIGLGLAVVLPAGATDDARALAGAVVGAFAGLLFVVAVAPPRSMRTGWRSVEDEELQSATGRLMLATTLDDVARTVLPSMVDLMGADAGAIVAADGRPRALHGLHAEDVVELDGDVLDYALVRLQLARGDRLLLRTSPYAPLFGEDERRLLNRLAALVDLANDRAVLLMSEREARRDAERANREVEAFVATITHDLRNPLTAIVGMSDLLAGPLKDELSERALTFAERISANAAYMTGMVTDILDLAEINAHHIDPEPVDLNLIASVVREELVMREPTADVVVGALPSVLGDPTHLRRLFENVVNNAVKHAGRPDVKITVTANQHDDLLDLSFQDNGVGIPPDAAERVFGLFEQLEGSEGSGLGLAICRKLVEGLGGRIWFEDSDVGANLRMQFPASIIVRTGPDRADAARESAVSTGEHP